MCCSRTPLLSRRGAFYSSQTEVNAVQSSCTPARLLLCERVFDGRQRSGWMGWGWMGCGGVVGGTVVIVIGVW